LALPTAFVRSSAHAAASAAQASASSAEGSVKLPQLHVPVLNEAGEESLQALLLCEMAPEVRQVLESMPVPKPGPGDIIGTVNGQKVTTRTFQLDDLPEEMRRTMRSMKQSLADAEEAVILPESFRNPSVRRLPSDARTSTAGAQRGMMPPLSRIPSLLNPEVRGFLNTVTSMACDRCGVVAAPAVASKSAKTKPSPIYGYPWVDSVVQWWHRDAYVRGMLNRSSNADLFDFLVISYKCYHAEEDEWERPPEPFDLEHMQFDQSTFPFMATLLRNEAFDELVDSYPWYSGRILLSVRDEDHQQAVLNSAGEPITRSMTTVLALCKIHSLAQLKKVHPMLAWRLEYVLSHMTSGDRARYAAAFLRCLEHAWGVEKTDSRRATSSLKRMVCESLDPCVNSMWPVVERVKVGASQKSGQQKAGASDGQDSPHAGAAAGGGGGSPTSTAKPAADSERKLSRQERRQLGKAKTSRVFVNHADFLAKTEAVLNTMGWVGGTSLSATEKRADVAEAVKRRGPLMAVTVPLIDEGVMRVIPVGDGPLSQHTAFRQMARFVTVEPVFLEPRYKEMLGALTLFAHHEGEKVNTLRQHIAHSDIVYPAPPRSTLPKRFYIPEPSSVPKLDMSSEVIGHISVYFPRASTLSLVTASQYSNIQRIVAQMEVALRTIRPRLRLCLFGGVHCGFSRWTASVDVCAWEEVQNGDDIGTDEWEILDLMDWIQAVPSLVAVKGLCETAGQPAIECRSLMPAVTLHVSQANDVSLRTTALLRAYGRVYQDLPLLVGWLKRLVADVMPHGRREEWPSSTCLTVMMIAFLQRARQPGILPCLHEMLGLDDLDDEAYLDVLEDSSAIEQRMVLEQAMKNGPRVDSGMAPAGLMALGFVKAVLGASVCMSKIVWSSQSNWAVYPWDSHVFTIRTMKQVSRTDEQSPALMFVEGAHRCGCV
jgi:hypothetical protein